MEQKRKPALARHGDDRATLRITTPFSGNMGTGSMGYELTLDASRFASWVFAFGGELFDPVSQQYTLNSQEAIDAMTFLQNLFNMGCATLVSDRYGDQTDFGAGKLLFAIGSSSGLPYYRSAVNEGADFDWNVGALPHTTEDPNMNIYGASISIPKHTPERELAAWLFLKFFTSVTTTLNQLNIDANDTLP